METKQLVMLIFLLAVAFVGSGALIYVLQSLDRDEDGNGGGSHGHDDHGHH